MNFREIVINIAKVIGGVYRTFLKKPFNIFMDLKFKYKVFVIILLLLLFDGLRFFIFSILVWLVK